MESLESSSSSSSSVENHGMKTENWSHKIEYILSTVGFCVGLGNIWRFPYICMRNGGGAFLIPFLFFLLTCGLPLFFLEVAVGQFLGKGALKALEICPLFRGIGLGMLILAGNVALYYNVIVAWVLYYIGNSFFNPLPFMECGNTWNTEYCVSDRSIIKAQEEATSVDNFNYTTNFSMTSEVTTVGSLNISSNITVLRHNASLLVSSTEEFWECVKHLIGFIRTS